MELDSFQVSLPHFTRGRVANIFFYLGGELVENGGRVGGGELAVGRVDLDSNLLLGISLFSLDTTPPGNSVWVSTNLKD